MDGKIPQVEYDLCIIGAGFFGCCAARHASANPNLKICLIGLDEPSEEEYEGREIFSSHYDEGRIVKVLFESPAYQELSLKSIKSLKHLEKLSGMKFYSPVGFLQIGKKGNYGMKHLEDVSAALGTPLTEISDKTFLKKIYPFLQIKDDEYGLLDNTGAGVISARQMLVAEKKIARLQGCEIFTDTVVDVGGRTNGYHTVETKKYGKIRSKRILFTTGSFTNVNHFNILPQLEMYVYRELAALVKISINEAERLSCMPGMIYQRDQMDIGSYILPPVQYPDGNFYLKIGSMQYQSGAGMQTAKEIKEWFLSKETDGETQAMSNILFEVLQGLKSEGIVRKICVTCEAPTGLPYIDHISPTVCFAGVGNGWGSTTAEEIGRLAAHLCLTGEWDSNLPKSLFEIIKKSKN